MNTERPSRFQFSLLELLGIVMLAGCVVFLTAPWVLSTVWRREYVWPPAMRYAAGVRMTAALLIAAVTCAGAFFGLWRAHRCQGGPWRRAGSALSWAFCGWLGLVIFSGIFEWTLQPRYRCGNQGGAAASCEAFAEAEEIYHRTDYKGDGVLVYAQSLHALLETSSGARDLALVDTCFADAELVNGHAVPKAGYVFKVLKSQGPAAKGGAKSYLARGADGKERMTEGFALAACPAVYDQTGRYMFIISHDGTIYMADFGPKTPEVFEQMAEFNPDPKVGWEPAD
ncbi:MAG: DUF2950 family protein [Planctomycetota bacterium]